MSKLIKKKSQKQEKRVACALNGKTTIASGALDFQKADVRTDKYLVECKYTDKDFYSLKTSIWEKIRNEAIKDGLRIPLMQIELNGGSIGFAVLDVNDLQAEFDENNKYLAHVVNVMDVNAKSFRIKEDIVGSCLSVKHIPITVVRIGKYTLAVVTWLDFVLLQN